MHGLIRNAAPLLSVVAVLSLSACAAPFPEEPDFVGEGYPSNGIPTEVRWPSDWLEGMAGEPRDGIGGRIVELALEYRDDAWVWRVTSTDPKRDWLDEQVVDPLRGLEAILDAETLSTLDERHVSLPEEAVVGIDVGPAEAARMSGEASPNPRLVSLALASRGDDPVWEAGLYDTVTGEVSETTIDALGEGEATPPAKP